LPPLQANLELTNFPPPVRVDLLPPPSNLHHHPLSGGIRNGKGSHEIQPFQCSRGVHFCLLQHPRTAHSTKSAIAVATTVRTGTCLWGGVGCPPTPRAHKHVLRVMAAAIVYAIGQQFHAGCCQNRHPRPIFLILIVLADSLLTIHVGFIVC
jgi:hypothetical protein